MTALANMRGLAQGTPLPLLGRLTANDARTLGLTKMQRGVVVSLEGQGFRFGFVHEPTDVAVVISDDGRMAIRGDGKVAWLIADGEYREVAGVAA